MIIEEGDLVWIHLRKERFPKEKNSKLKPRGDGPFKVLRRISNNAYIIDIPTDKYNVSNTFNVADLSPYHGDDQDLETRSTLSQEGGVDTGWPSDPSQAIPPSAPSGPMTRARAKLLHDKVNSLLSSCDFDTSLDGMLLHAPTLCILSYDSMGDRQDKAAKETGAKIKCGEAPGETSDETGEPVLPPKPVDDFGARTSPPDSPPKPFRFLPNRITASNSGARRNNPVRRNQTGASSGPPEFLPEFPATEPVRRTYRRNASDLAATNLGFDAPSSYQTTLLFLFYPCIRWRTIYSSSPPLSFLRLEVIS